MIRRIASFSLVALLPLLAHADPGADYASHCAACHGADRLGGTGPALIPETRGRLKGIDQIRFDDEGLIVDFEVMIRPLNALQALGAEMGARLAAYLPAYKAHLA